MIGVDEVARGCLVGPVVACALILKPDVLKNWDNINRPKIGDSKTLSAKARSEALKWITETGALAYAIGESSVDEIEELNIRNATFLAMNRALAKLPLDTLPSNRVVVDGNAFKIMPGFDQLSSLDITTVIKADLHNPTVSCASIVAKEYRDTLLDNIESSMPEFGVYGWKNNRGYGTKDHLAAILREGITVHHRLSFLKNLLHPNS